MKQHYVPRFYLNYFCDDRIQNGKYLWRYKCGESQAIKSATKRIASIPNYYTNREVYASREDRQVGDLSASLPSRE